ncbi:MAG: response regulator [Fibrobacterota bacterium]|nr:response regulator [Fibrobacterota bacterium]QQS06084.1 MAG: response regulator [Fibrobacterota bacterium]
MSAHRILLVEDEPAIADAVQWTLSSEGFLVEWASTWSAARPLLHRCDLAILDVGLPDKSGFDACRELRRDHDFPVIFLTARGEEIDRVVGLEIGADDYVVKPFSPRELVARVRARLRGRRTEEAAPIRASDTGFLVDADRATVSFRGQPLALTPMEMGILRALLEKPGRVLSRERLLDLACPDGTPSLERTVDTHVRSLRRKLSEAGAGDPIETRRGIGYAMRPGSVP